MGQFDLSKAVVPEQVPFRDNGIIWHYTPDVIAMTSRTTGEMFVRGEDYEVKLPDGRELPFKDKETAKKMSSMPLNPVYCEPSFEPNRTFEDTLQFIAAASAVSMAFLATSDDRQLTMFYEEFVELRKQGLFKGGECHGLWTFIQLGNRYAVRLLKAM